MRRLVLLSVLALLLAACGGGDGGGDTPTSEPSATPARTPTAGGTCLPGEARAPVLAACQALAEQLEASPSEVELVSATPKEWPDSCLGAPRPGEACAEVITPGFEVVLRLASAPSRYTYHTDQGANVRLANVDLNSSEPADIPLGEPLLVARGFEPVAFDFAPDGRIFFTERQRGEIRTVDLSSIDSYGELWAEVPTFRGSECGLLGIALDPEFASNHYLYVYVTQPVADRTDAGKPRLIRYTDANGAGTNPRVLIDDLPLTNTQNCAHVGGNLHFGPDGYLYLSLGNFERPRTAADLSSPSGKFLRIDKRDGSPAPGNPFAGRTDADGRVFAYGLRNPWDFAFHPQTGKIYAPDNGPGNCDELNIIEPGADYGVPGSLPPAEVESCLGLGGVDPIHLFAQPGKRPEEFGSNVAPAGVAFLPAGRYADLGVGLLVCEFVTNTLRFLELAGPEQNTIGRDLVLATDCLFNVEVDREGTIYYSNGEGIVRLPPQ